tara:strand:- start:443 stop:583 length:141 start_codon:yes stop_codon:yes gene_type:complete
MTRKLIQQKNQIIFWISVIELEATDEKALQHININDLILHEKKSAL